MSYALLRQAILERKQVHCFAGGHERYLCPHAIGTKAGREQVLSFQFAGSSSTRLPAEGDWRCMPVASITEVRLLEGPWRTGKRQTVKQTCIDRVDVEVAY